MMNPLDLLNLLDEAIGAGVELYKDKQLFDAGADHEKAKKLDEMESTLARIRAAKDYADDLQRIIDAGLFDESKDPNNRDNHRG